MKEANARVILDYSELQRITEAHKTIGHRIVCTIGSWDMLHIGHLRYLIKAKQQGDILVVGVDSDQGIKIYKRNPLRPIIPQEERMEMLQYQACVDYVTLVEDIDPSGKWQYGLVQTIRPHVFVSTTDSYPEDQLQAIRGYAQEVAVFPRQAESTSSSGIIEKTVKEHLESLLSELIRNK